MVSARRSRCSVKPKNNWTGLRDCIFWLSVPITCALCFSAVDMGPSVEAGQQLGRAFVAGAIGLICYVTSSEPTP